MPRARIAIAWLLSRAGLAAPIIGASREGQIEDAVKAVDIRLTEEDVRELEAHYVPHRIMGFE